MAESQRYDKEELQYIYDTSIIHILRWLDKHFFTLCDFEKKSILDVGCWWGWFVKYAADRGASAFGFDIEKERIDDARRFAETGSFCVCGAQDISFASGCFDLVFAWDILEHVTRPDRMISEIGRVLKQEGTLILAVPNDYNLATLPYRWCRFLLNRRDVFLKEGRRYDFIRSLAYTDNDHKREYTTGAIRAVLEAGDFKIEHMKFYGLDLPVPLRGIFTRRQQAFIRDKCGAFTLPWLRSHIVVKASKKTRSWPDKPALTIR